MRVRLLLVPIVAAAALLAGCASTSTPTSTAPTTNGLEKLEAAQILQKATDALTAAKSFRVKGKSEVEGETGEIDLTYAGKTAKGTITFDGMTLDLIQTADATYVKAADDFWKTIITDESYQAAALAALAGKYVKFPSDTEQIVPDAKSFLKPESGDFAKGDVVTVEGKQAITLKAADGDLHVSLEGEPYPIDIVAKDGSALKFLDIDQDVTIEAPAGALDLTAILTQIMMSK